MSTSLTRYFGPNFGIDMDLAANPALTMPDFGEDMDLAANPALC